MRAKDAATVAAVALPPVSRKLVQRPEWLWMASRVFMARPAPFTEKGIRESSIGGGGEWEG